MTRSEVKLKLLCHPRVDTKSRVSDDVLLDSRDNHGILPGDIIELRHPDHPTPTLFLVKSLREDFQHKDAISIEQSLAQSIKLQPYKTVSVKVVFKGDVLLDFVEISFRDQYYGRRDLMEFTNNMTDSIVHLNTMLEYGVMRGYISELWRKGEVTSSGYVSERTKIFYRSSSAVFHIFIQMSKEMWNFDEFGDLFFEKGVKFLRELILQSWTNMSCTHDVTLILSTRVFVSAPSVEIPEKSVFSRNADGQVYVDFYKVIIHNERYSIEEWKKSFSQLMLAFKGYEQEIRNYVLRNLPGINDSKHVSIRLSTARETNILEGLNLALSSYECYNVDRSFDRTGNACIVIAPGCGVFDANCDIVSFTKRRVLDLGTVVHLVCLGHQPLHAVPLFVCRDFANPANPEVYIVPHWMNHSFFRSSREICALKNSETVPRISVKARKFKESGDSYYWWKHLEKEGEGEHDRNTFQGIFEPAKSLRELRRLRRRTLTTLVSTTMPDKTRQRTISLEEELLLASIAVVSTRPMEGGLSASELDSFGSTSSTHGWNVGAHLRSRTQSYMCSETHSPLGGNLLLTDEFSPEARDEPPWLTLYGYPTLESGCTRAAKKGLGGRNYSNATEALIRRKPQDLTHSYQSGSSYQPQVHSRPCKNAAAPVDFLAGASASSWQPTGGREVGRRQSHPVLARNASKKPLLLTSTETAVGGVFRTFPFGIHPQLFGIRKTTSQRRWGHFYTTARQMHLIKYDQTQCMRLLEGLRPRIILAKIWHAYFAFHRYVVATLLNEAEVKTRNQQQQGIENIRNPFSVLPLHRSTEHQMPTTSSGGDDIPSQCPPAPKVIDSKGSFSYGRMSIPFSDLPHQFTSSAAWLALCAAVDSPDIAQVCSHGNADIISSGEVKSLEKAFTSVSAEFGVERVGGAVPSLVPHHRRLLREMLKPVGIDWKSLTTPALLPLTTDYFPEASSLLGEGYMIHEYRIVLITVSEKEWDFHFDTKAFPGLAYSRHPLSGQQVLEELVSQRVAQGFQLCIEEEAASTSATSATPLKTSDARHSVTSSNSPAEQLPGSLTPVPPTPKRAIHSHSLAFRLRHQVAQKAGATKATMMPTGLQERPGPPVTPQPRMTAQSPFTGSLASASKTVPSKSKNYRLSMGSLFHSVTLQPDETITITKYQAKRAQKIENYATTYRYMLEVPDGLTYYPLEITFTNRLVWAFNWSYLDNLVATQGVNESYEIVAALKFWRSRFLILPAFKDTTRRLADSLREAKAKGTRVRCDVYETPLASIGYEKLCDRFITFLESLNRIRRTNVPHRGKQFNWAEAVDPQRACHDTVTQMSTAAPPSNPTRRHGTLATPTLELERAVVSEGSARSAATTPVPPTPLAPLHSTGSLSSTSVSASASPSLPLSTHSEIWRVIAAILDPEYGLTFITGTALLPKHTFCAYDLTNWLTRNLVDIPSKGAAVKYAQGLLNSGYICHTSGNRAHKFLNGFFLYTILAEVTSSLGNQETGDMPSGRKSAGVDTEASKSLDVRKIPFPTTYLPPSSTSPLGSFSTDFQKEWVEVLVVREAPAVTHPITSHASLASTFYPSSPSSSASSDELEAHFASGLLSTQCLGRIFGVENTSGIHVGSEGVLRKRVTRDLRDTSTTTAAAAALKRHPEWYCLLYDLNYHPTCAFVLEIQWLVASASRLNEMLLLYIYYKATSPGFHIVPAPCYPFGYSGTRYSLDPLRLHVFVPCRLLQLIFPQNDTPTRSQNLSPCSVAAELFPELPEPEQMIALFYFQERILSKFGFIPLSYSPAVQPHHHSHQGEGGESLSSKRVPQSVEEPPRGMIYTQRMYVHVSGGMFAMIPLYPSPPQPLPPPAMNAESEDRLSDYSTPRRTSINVYPPSTCSYVTTLCSDTNVAVSQQNREPTTATGRRAALDRRTSCFEAQTEVGFFWAWNHMLPRKWRGQTTGDEAFQVGMLEDFRAFCSGSNGEGIDDGRLVDTFYKFKAALNISVNVGTPIL